MEKKTEEMLKKDSLAETEMIVGKHWEEFNQDEQLFSVLRAIANNQKSDEYFSSVGDTHFRMKWEEFKTLLKNKGFKNALSYNFVPYPEEKKNPDEAILYYHPEKGLVIFATSFGDSVNGGNLYGEIQANDKESLSDIRKWISTGGCIDDKNLIFDTSHDVREGLFSKLAELEKHGKFLDKWTDKRRFLFFVDYSETKDKAYNYRAITQSKIEKCPQEFRYIIGR